MGLKGFIRTLKARSGILSSRHTLQQYVVSLQKYLKAEILAPWHILRVNSSAPRFTNIPSPPSSTTYTVLLTYFPFPFLFLSFCSIHIWCLPKLLKTAAKSHPLFIVHIEWLVNPVIFSTTMCWTTRETEISKPSSPPHIDRDSCTIFTT